jgi:hypothetical protein
MTVVEIAQASSQATEYIYLPFSAAGSWGNIHRLFVQFLLWEQLLQQRPMCPYPPYPIQVTGLRRPYLSVQDEKTGEWLPLLEITSGVGWLHWEQDKKSKSASVTFAAMSYDSAEDHRAVAIWLFWSAR